MKLSGAALVGGVAMACNLPGSSSGSSTQELTLYNWGTPVDKKIWDDAIGRFNQTHPSVKVINNIVPVSSWADYADKLATLAASGKSPDLINIGIEGYRLGVAKNLVIPVDGRLSGSPALTSDIDRALFAPASVNSKVYWVPHLYETMVIFYNTTIFQKAGINRPADDWTWDDFLAIAKQLTSGSGGSKVWGYGHAYANFQLHPWLLTNDAYQVTPDYKGSNLTDPKLIESVGFIKDLVRVHKVAPDVQGFNPNDSFAGGKVAMVGAGHYAMQTFIGNNFNDYDIVPWPRRRSNSTVFGTAGWGISTHTKFQDAAWDLIKEFVSPTTELDKAKAGVNEPVSNQALNSPEFLKQPKHASLFHDVIRTAKPVANPANYGDLERIFMRHLDEVMSGAKTPEAAMKEADDELRASFARIS